MDCWMSAQATRIGFLFFLLLKEENGLKEGRKGAFDSAVSLLQKAKLNLQKDKPELMHFI